MKLSVVVPAQNEADNLVELLERVRDVLDPMGHTWELVVVDDGSTDGTWKLLTVLAEADPRVRGLRLSRNFGHQIALTAGLWAADGDAVVTMDGDLQHPPEMIPAILDTADEGYDVVYAVPSERDSEGWFKVRTARVFYWLLNKLTRLDLPHGGADFRFMSRRVIDALLAMPERHRFLRGMTRWVGYSQTMLEYDRAARGGGASKYSLTRMLSFAMDAIVSFSAIPLRLASVMGLIISALGGIYFIYVLVAKVATDSVIPGWTSVVVAVLLLGGVQLACLGIIGQYLGHMYEDSKGRPLFLLADDTRGQSAGEPNRGTPAARAGADRDR
jgi:polyisoprenyl-phosphate glycosyltransferase